MDGYRNKGRKVILVGDLNIAHEAIDTHWNFRRVRVDKILSSISEPEAQWQRDIKAKWRKIIEQLNRTREVVEQVTSNSRTGEKHNKWRLRCRPLAGVSDR